MPFDTRKAAAAVQAHELFVSPGEHMMAGVNLRAPEYGRRLANDGGVDKIVKTLLNYELATGTRAPAFTSGPAPQPMEHAFHHPQVFAGDLGRKLRDVAKLKSQLRSIRRDRVGRDELVELELITDILS